MTSSCIQAYAYNFRPKSPHHNSNAATVRISSNKWSNLDDKTKATWDQLDEMAKSIVLAELQPIYHLRHPHLLVFLAIYIINPPFSSKPPYKPKAHLHEISAYDYILAYMHDLDPQHVKNELSVDFEDLSHVAELVDTRHSKETN